MNKGREEITFVEPVIVLKTSYRFSPLIAITTQQVTQYLCGPCKELNLRSVKNSHKFTWAEPGFVA